MNPELDRLANQLRLPSPHARTLALAFGLRCIERVEHLLEPEVVACVQALRRHVAGQPAGRDLETAAADATRLAEQQVSDHEATFATGSHKATWHQSLAARFLDQSGTTE